MEEDEVILAKLITTITNMILVRILVPEVFGVVAKIKTIISFQICIILKYISTAFIWQIMRIFICINFYFTMLMLLKNLEMRY